MQPSSGHPVHLFMAPISHLIPRIYGLTFYLLMTVSSGCWSLVSGDENEDEKRQRHENRSHVLAVLFGFYTVCLMLAFVMGILMSISMFGFRVFARVPALPLLRSPDQSHYENF